MFHFFGHLFSFVLRGFFRIFLILIMVGISHMSQNEKFAAVELAKAGLGQKHAKRRTQDFQRGNHENRSKSPETSHTKVP